ncbi:SidA/IucD/PvdA family monooxygenase [Actinomadura madurae]|uniref:SidA/IucD/PvdA family monooxygenase n=1 Tax=Actinomadura madurae TaxID=1993 RepID=UPI0020261BFC|nr:SidA/IucD/PvdA family monooxygenase [Actinomadura madurae]MCP9977393.1 lysine N(6)-hydroxylase/L-ornithine N(5)-oxygenase family protein [Actinomadura madurae]MCQ0011102.1 lysine N(6)-hydroxylase/L-ornithine N(5)-oxygenase family protein [Actinomadura madurae]URM93802.1 lysine N(6)-hydroxylase/L-ornithine N(5)-oxygenase family protein [Actinomadura madurae]
MNRWDVEVLAIGAGPSNLALAVALEELAPDLAARTLLVERHDSVVWQRGMLLPWARSQVSFLKDLVTLRNPRSEFTFLNYLHAVGRLDQFVNLGTFQPYRTEVSDYLRWVAGSLAEVRIEYGRRVVAVEPVWDDGSLDGWCARFADGPDVTCRHLVVGVGREPRVPDVFRSLPGGRVVHSSRFQERVDRLDPDAAHRFAVVGGAQSAAEMLWETYRRFPRAECVMVTRSIGLKTYEHSRFANELYYPSFTGDFHAGAPGFRARTLAEMRGTNYGALDPDLLDALYDELYRLRLTGSNRMRILPMTEVVRAGTDGTGALLTLADRRTGDENDLPCDLVLLGTGFRGEMPPLVRRIAEAVSGWPVAVDRYYRMALPPSATATCHLQGVNEATHGIADSLLSVLGVRAEEIVTDLLKAR